MIASVPDAAPPVPFDAPCGAFTYCPVCYPMIYERREPLEVLLRGETVAEKNIEVWEDGERVRHLHHALINPRIPGVIVVQYETWSDGRKKLCTTCLDGNLVQIRYAPTAELRKKDE